MMARVSDFFRIVAGLAGLCLVVSACTPPGPFIRDVDEFNRENKNFNKKPDDVSEVTVCYSTRNATPKQVRDLAKARCAEYGKVARLTGRSLLNCPTFTPSGAEFDCLSPEAARGRAGSGTYGSTAPHGGAYSWSYTNPTSPLESLLPLPGN